MPGLVVTSRWVPHWVGELDLGGLCLLAIGMGAIWLDLTVCGDLAGYAQKGSALLRGFLVLLTYELLYEAHELAVVSMTVVCELAPYPCLARPI